MAKIQVNTTYLNHNWDYVPSYDKGYIKEFPESVKVKIPHTNIETPFNNFSENIYQFKSSYQNVFEFTKKPKKRYQLHFDGVMAFCEVYLNGKLISSHKGGYTPFRVEVTKQLKNGENKLFVMVDSTERKDIPPHGFVVDYLTYGGIYREVYIEEHDKNFIDNAFIHIDNDELNVRMFLDIQKQEDTIFKYHIFKDNQLVYFFEREYDLKKKDILVTEKVYLDMWTLEEPTLYELEILVEDEVIYKSRFGNRSVKMTPEGFYLNGERIQLIGLNRHQSFPYVGYAMPKNAQEKDADILKYELGCNVVRSSHYPPSRHFLNRCDEIGLLVFNEIPGWQHIGDKAWQAVAIENVKEMIYRDYNHPSIFIWGTRINESPDNDEFYTETNRVAKLYDTTRPTGGVRNFTGSNLIEDVYTYNDFIHRGNNPGVERPSKIAKGRHPYLVTEYNGHMYPTKKFDDEYHREYQVKRHLKVQNDAFKNKNISGAIGWCMFDYNTHKDFGSGDRICYHGVMDMFRIPKDAASVYRSQGSKEPYIHVMSGMNIGDREAGEIKEVFVMTNVDYVKFYINDQFMGDFYPTDRYPNLPHPPIIIDDFIGNLVHENESFSEKDADVVKQILIAIARDGRSLPLLLRIRMLFVLIKYKMSIDQAAKLYEKYIGKWGLESLTYKLEGVKDKIVVTTKVLGQSHENDIHVFADHEVITESSTYETTRVVVKHLDGLLNPLLYSTEVINVSVKGPLELIGPNQIALIGGSTGFYLKTNGKKGKATITISSNNFEDKVIKITVK